MQTTLLTIDEHKPVEYKPLYTDAEKIKRKQKIIREIVRNILKKINK
jgi:hypothetical protein